MSELVTVFKTADGMLLSIVKSALQAAGIEIVVQGEGALGLFPLGPTAFGLSKNLVEASILVESEDVADAQTILAGVDESESS